MRTTISISESLYRDVKARAAQTARSISEVIEDALRDALRTQARDEVPELPALPVFGGGGVCPGVDLGDPSALRDLMDEGVTLDALR